MTHGVPGGLMMSVKLLLIGLVATASAFKVATPPLVKPVAPVKPADSLSAALDLRGGGIVDAGMWLKVVTAFFGMYGVGFLFAPAKLYEQNFEVTPDAFHLFMARNIGMSILFLMYVLNTAVDAPTAVKLLVPYMALSSLVGPVYAELKLPTKPAHKAALLMVPLIVSGVLAL